MSHQLRRQCKAVCHQHNCGWGRTSYYQGRLRQIELPCSLCQCVCPGYQWAPQNRHEGETLLLLHINSFIHSFSAAETLSAKWSSKERKGCGTQSTDRAPAAGRWWFCSWTPQTCGRNIKACNIMVAPTELKRLFTGHPSLFRIITEYETAQLESRVKNKCYLGHLNASFSHQPLSYFTFNISTLNITCWKIKKK